MSECRDTCVVVCVDHLDQGSPVLVPAEHLVSAGLDQVLNRMFIL